MNARDAHLTPPVQLELRIDGMVAVHAKHAVFQALAAVPGVTRATVELGRVVMECDHPPDEHLLREVIGAIGFELAEVRSLPRTLPML